MLEIVGKDSRPPRPRTSDDSCRGGTTHTSDMLKATQDKTIPSLTVCHYQHDSSHLTKSDLPQSLQPL